MGKDKKLDRKLYDAVKKGDIDAVKALLAQGANPNAPVGKKGMTSMTRAANGPNRELERILFSKGGTLHSSSKLAGDLKSMFDKDAQAGALAAGNSDTFVSKPSTPRQASETSMDSNASPKSPMPPGYLQIEDETMKKGSSLKPGAEEDVKQADEIERSHSPEKVRPMEPRMSQLALGADTSIRVKKNTRAGLDASTFSEPGSEPNEATKDEQNSDWQVPVKDDFPVKMNPKHRDWEFDRAKLKQTKKLGEGHFGVVFRGLAQGIVPGEGETHVAVKMLSDTSYDAREDFLKEAEIMKAIDGDHNIVRLLGVCTETTPYLMIMELMSKGDLKTVLRESRPKSTRPSALSMRQLVLMAADIAEGMGYLAFMKIVHRDLAARNCLVNDNLTVKIGDFGLTRDVYSGEYYRMTGSTPLPIRWMAPEAIMDGVYTTPSDIWAFGIVMWELMTFAKMPYAGLSNMEVCERVTEDDYRLPKPKECPAEMYQVMTDCWHEDPEQRPTFNDLYDRLKVLAAEVSDQPITKDGRLRSETGSSTMLGSSYARANASSPLTVDGYDNLGDDGEVNDSYKLAASGKASKDSSRTPSIYEYQEPADARYAESYGGQHYVRRDQMEDDGPDSQQLYTDTRYSGLPDIEQAVRRAKNANEIQDVALEKRSHSVVGRAVEEEIEGHEKEDQPYYSRASSNAEIKKAAAASSNDGATGREAPSELDQTPTKLSDVRAQWAQKDQTARSMSESFATKPVQPSGKKIPKYGGSTSWVTAGPSKVAAGYQGPDVRRAAQQKAAEQAEAAANLGNPDAGKPPLSKQSSDSSVASSASSNMAPSPFGRKPSQSKPKYGGATSWVTGGRQGPSTLYIPLTNRVKDQVPYNKIQDEKFLEEEERRRAGPSELVREAERRREDLLISAKSHLANDSSETAAKAKNYSKDIMTKAEKDIQLWIEAVIGDYLPGDSLQESLKSGEVLCAVMDKISPGSVGRYHRNTRMAFKQMENIGWFIEACRDYGVSETDIFITIDLFESRNMKQVVICLSALKKLSEARGFST